ncbi:hypothetical protein LEP1GSC193_0945 [Leptospira alstonii serovar Pingchang str. 80-412]|uniref:Uncharacterized protein n=1 Tax=Leptospira alstonii serovar Pingchang str. 80-412 TaxID=1218564 RepID=T0G543_9LEPT|nr:hypothetical protein LEP1GSC193_0945 [Leptospira alstonii serovar Pingchang str. 80-412]
MLKEVKRKRLHFDISILSKIFLSLKTQPQLAATSFFDQAQGRFGSCLV